MKILVTGVAGFIGMHVANALLKRGDEVIGIDNLNNYYDLELKKARLKKLKENKEFSFNKIDISLQEELEKIFVYNKPQRVIHLAAQAGVRYSLKKPRIYILSNLLGFFNILESCKNSDIEHLVYSSSSSVYGLNYKVPFSEKDNVDHPISLYAATKKSNELMAHSYSHLFDLPTTGLRYFTVYGPWGRPDMSPWIFTNAIINNQKIDVYNFGKSLRDFTYIDDIVRGTILVLDNIPKKNKPLPLQNLNPSSSLAPWKIYNVGNSKPVNLLSFIETLEEVIGKKSKKNMLPIQDGDLPSTSADLTEIKKDFGFQTKIQLRDGIEKWYEWYKNHNL